MRGGAAVSAQDNRWLRCDIKSISLIGNVLLRQLSAEAGAPETILFRDGKLTEASASNVFIVKRGVILSPPKSTLILPGITYDVVAELARANGMPLEFRDVPEAEVRAADEIWVTSSSKEVLAIVSLDGQQGRRRQAGPAVPPHVRALPGVQAQRDARRQAGGAVGVAMVEGSPLAFPCDFPIKVMGRKQAGFAQDSDGHGAAARAGLRRRDDGDAAQPPEPLPEHHLHRARDFARAARRPVPGAVRPSRRGDGAMTVVDAIAVRQLGSDPVWRCPAGHARIYAPRVRRTPTRSG